MSKPIHRIIRVKETDRLDTLAREGILLNKIISTGMLAVILLAVSGCGLNKKQIDEAHAHYVLGLSYLREHKISQSLTEFKQAEEIDSKDPEIQSALGQAYHLKEAYPEAEKHYLDAIKYSHSDPKNLNNLAALYLDMKRWDDAIRYFRAAADSLVFDRQEVPIAGMGYAFYQKGDYLQAVTEYKRAIELNSHYAPAYLGLGQAYYALDKTDDAVAQYREALNIAPNYAQAYYYLGLAQIKLRQKEEAIASFEEVVRLLPDSEIGHLAKDHLKILQ